MRRALPNEKNVASCQSVEVPVLSWRARGSERIMGRTACPQWGPGAPVVRRSEAKRPEAGVY